MMKNFYYSFTQSGTLLVWLAAPDEKPELLAHVAPVFNKTGTMQTQGWGTVPTRQDMVNADGVPVIIECLFHYQLCYSQN